MEYFAQTVILQKNVVAVLVSKLTENLSMESVDWQSVARREIVYIVENVLSFPVNY